MQALGDQADLVVDLAGPGADLPSLGVAAFHHPQVGDGAQYGHQRRVRHHHYAALVAVVEQIAVVLHGLDICRLNRHEHEHEIRAADIGKVAVILPGQIIDMFSHRSGVGRKGLVSPDLVVRGNRPVVVDQRHLAVDHQMLAVGQFDQEIRQPALAILVAKAGLRLVVVAGLQPGQLQRALQLCLAPVAGGFLVAFQCLGQVAGLVIHLQADLQNFLDLGLQGGIALERLAVHLVDAGLETGDLLAEWLQQAFHRGLAGAGEVFALVLEDAMREVLEFALQCFLVLVE